MNCKTALVSGTFCYFEKAFAASSDTCPSNNSFCHKGSILQNDTCFYFAWHNRASRACREKKMRQLKPRNIRQFHFLFHAVSSVFPIIALRPSDSLATGVTFENFFNSFQYSSHILHKGKSAIHICFKIKQQVRKQESVLLCPEKGYISKIHLCNEVADCPNSTDESGCICSTSNFSSSCKYLIDDLGKKTCSILYYNTCNKNCHPYISITNHTKSARSSDGKAILKIKEGMNSSGDEGMSAATQLDTIFTCQQNGAISCGTDPETCHSISAICIFKKNKFGTLDPCRNGAHLQDCKLFECHDTFKCPLYHCIPWQYVCDGQWDCPGAFDESHQLGCGLDRQCKSMFKCHTTGVCIHMNDVCDGVANCAENDDEFFCLPSDHTCPPSCLCLFLALQCSGTNLTMVGVREYLFSYVQFSKYINNNAFEVLPKFPSALILVANDCGLKEICSGILSIHIVKLDFSDNDIEYIGENCFMFSTDIKILSLNINKIATLTSGSLSNLQELSYLNLSSNNISCFASSTVASTIHLLELKRNPLQEELAKSFLNLTVKVLSVEKYSICCIVDSNVKCTAKQTWDKSCSNLLSTVSARITYYVVSLTIFVCSVVSIVVHQFLRSSKADKGSTFGKLVVSLNLADLTYAMYLIIVCVSDTQYGIHFVLMERIWNSSTLCLVCLGLALCFAAVYPVLLCLLSFARFSLVKHPLSSSFKKASFVTKTVSSIWGFSVFLSASFTVFFTFHEKIIPNNLCSPFFEVKYETISIKTVTIVTVLLQMIAIIFMLVFYVKMINEIAASQKSLQQSMSKTKSNVPKIIQIAGLTMSNIFSWIPSGVICFTIMFLKQYPTQIMTWTIVTATPVNSLVIPVVFTVVTMNK